MPGQHGDVLGAIAQWRDLYHNDIEAIIEIIAESTLPDGRLQIGVGGGDDALIDLDIFQAPQSAKLPFLDYAQKFDLNILRNR